MFEGDILSHEGCIAAEKLAGNTIKESFHKGAVYAFSIAREKVNTSKKEIERGMVPLDMVKTVLRLNLPKHENLDDIINYLKDHS